MRKKRSVPGWRVALTSLQISERELEYTEAGPYSRPKISNDSLENDTIRNDTIRECFCYCELFPEDYEIEVFDLITC